MALKGLEADRAKLEQEIAQIKRELGHSGTSAVGGTLSKKRTMSPEARRRISEGMKRRYAELRKAIGKKRAA